MRRRFRLLLRLHRLRLQLSDISLEMTLVWRSLAASDELYKASGSEGTLERNHFSSSDEREKYQRGVVSTVTRSEESLSAVEQIHNADGSEKTPAKA